MLALRFIRAAPNPCGHAKRGSYTNSALRGLAPYRSNAACRSLLYAAQFGKVGFAAELKWLPQIGAKNTLKGDYIWLKFAMQF